MGVTRILLVVENGTGDEGSDARGPGTGGGRVDVAVDGYGV